MTDEERTLLERTVPAAVLQAIGVVLLLTAVAVLYDGWYVIGALGIALTFGRVDDLHDALVLLRLAIRRRRNGDG